MMLTACCLSVADFYEEQRDADSRTWFGSRQRGEASPVPAVPQILQQQPSARAAHQGPHRRETVQM